MIRTALIGDSHARVVFRTMEKLLPQAGFNPIYKKAENGWGLKKHIDRGLLPSLRQAKPEVILVSLGGNNQKTKTADYQKTVDQLLSTAKAIGSRIIWVGPTTSDTARAASTERRHEWTHQFLQKYLPSKGIDYINMRYFTQSGWKSDGVHYPSSKYKRWAEMVTQKMGELKEQLKPGVSPLMIGAGVAVLTLLTAGTAILVKKRKGSGFKLPEGRGERPLHPAVEIAKHLDGLITKNNELAKRSDAEPWRRHWEGPYEADLTLPHDILDMDPSMIWRLRKAFPTWNPMDWKLDRPSNSYYLKAKDTGRIFAVESKHKYSYGDHAAENQWWKALKPEHREHFLPVLKEYTVDGYKVFELPAYEEYSGEWTRPSGAKVPKTAPDIDFAEILGDWTVGTIFNYNGKPAKIGYWFGPKIVSYFSSPSDLAEYKKTGLKQ
jgi:hypothetical protein